MIDKFRCFGAAENPIFEFISVYIPFLSLLIATTSVYAGEVRLANDSQFPLLAQVHSAGGQMLGTVEVPPHQTVTWEGGWAGAAESESPFSIRWICKEGGKEFSYCTSAGEGSLVTASSCPGPNTCPTKKSNQSDEEETTP